jgi:dolichol-phosphate mannosyltransferase
MNDASPAPAESAARPRSRLTTLLPVWGWALLAVTAVQVVIAAIFPVLPEEAYHWNFARHLDYGYYDHPPMLPWAIALGCSVLGDTGLGIRLVPLLFSFGTALLLARLARRFYGEAAPTWAVLLYAMQPAAFFIGGWGFPDSPVLFFWLLTLTWVSLALDTGRPAWWLAAGAALGAGMLSKYTASFLVPSVFLYLICSRRDRRWLATPWPYLAGVCSLLVFSPVIWWNSTHQWVSFRFQSTARFQAANGVSFVNGLQATTEQWVFVLPLTIPLAVIAVRRLLRSWHQPEALLLWTFAPMALFFFLIGWTPSWHLLWSLPAYLALTVAMAGSLAQLQDRVTQFYRHRLGWMIGLQACGVVVIAVHGVVVLPGIPPLRDTYGWDQVAQLSQSLQATLPDGSFVMTASPRAYPSTSELAYHLRAPSLVVGQHLVGLPALQYRYWVNPKHLEGKDAVVVVPANVPPNFANDMLLPYFQAVEPACNLSTPVGTIGSWSNASMQFTIFLAHGYRGPATGAAKDSVPLPK